MAKLIQASDGYATDGERRAAEALRGLPPTWTVIANKVLPTRDGRSFEIDFIVIGERMIFAIDEKSWRGRISGSDVLWVRPDGSSERSPLNKIDYVAKVLAGFLREQALRFAQIEGHPVAGCVLLSQAEERPAIRDPRAANGVLRAGTAVETLLRLDAQGGDVRVGQLRAAIERALVDLSPRPRRPKAINDYQILEVMATRGPATIYRAQHPQAGPRLLTVYHLSPRDEADKEFYLQEFRALAQLRDTGLVPECSDPFLWSDEFLVIPSHLPRGVSLGSLPLPVGEDDVRRELERAAAAFRGLARIHEAGIVHRAIGPGAVYVDEQDDQTGIVLTDFFAAKRGNQTISGRLDALRRDDPYVAPEIAVTGSYGFAGAESDVYSLALVFLERLSGSSVSQIVTGDGVVRIPSPEHGWRYLEQDQVEELTDIFRATLTQGLAAPAGDPAAARLSAEACAARFAAFARRQRTDQAIAVGELLDNRYQVIRELGVGAFARTLLARDLEAEGLFALKQFLRPESIRESGEARREFNVLRLHPHPHLPYVYDLYPPSNSVHIKLEYVEGAKLSDVLSQFNGQLERCRRLAADLLSAVIHLEQHGLLHRDIKPDNVILRDSSGEAALIDFGAAEPLGASAILTGTPGYLPPEAYTATAPPPSSDRYAVAVLLFQALTGRMPFEDDGATLTQQPLADVDDLPPAIRPFAHALLRAVALDPARRYASAADFKTALLDTAAIVGPDAPALAELVNPWVDQVRRLFRNSRGGNADNRGLDTDFARETYVPTALDERLLPAIFARLPRAVFLSGNPGDGKTAFLERFEQALSERGGERIAKDESGWEWRCDGHTFRACYDASESHAGQSADEQLQARLAGLNGDAEPDAHLTVLVAINDGRLADAREKLRGEFGWLAAAIGEAQSGTAALASGGAWVIDLKRRSFLTLSSVADDVSVMRRVLATMTAPARWQVCEGCSARDSCPIRHNASAFAADDSSLNERLEYLLLLAQLRGDRHLTMRDLRSGLAYLITGDLRCEEVHAARREARSLPPRDAWHSTFTTESAWDVLLGEVQPLDPARSAQPALERFLFFHQAPDDAASRAALFTDGRDMPPLDDQVAWLGQVKRRLVFAARDDASGPTGVPRVDWRSLLPYRFAADFLAALAGTIEPAALLPTLGRGIGRSEGLSGPVLDSGVCLKIAHSEANRLTVIKQFPLNEFSLRVNRPSGEEMVESFPKTLTLMHRPSRARLDITLDLFEVLLRLADGMEPASPELRPLLEDLAPFKSAVQLSNTTDLILIEAGRNLHLLTQENDRIVRRSLAPGEAQ